MSFRKVRNAHKTENTEDYLELIAELLNSRGEARIVDMNNTAVGINTESIDAPPPLPW